MPTCSSDSSSLLDYVRVISTPIIIIIIIIILVKNWQHLTEEGDVNSYFYTYRGNYCKITIYCRDSRHYATGCSNCFSDATPCSLLTT